MSFRPTGSDGNSFEYLQARVIDDTVAGWKHYLALLTESKYVVGCFEPNFRDVKLRLPLGRGGSAVVNSGTFEKKEVLVKVYLAHKAASYQAEVDALKRLAGVGRVPHISFCLRLTNAIGGVFGEALVATPVSDVFAPRKGGHPVNGRHLKELIYIVQLAHSSALLHRDTKPDNVSMFNDSILLNDWSSAVSVNAERFVSGEGTVGFSVSRGDGAYDSLTGKARDLVSVVRTAYSLLFQEMPPPGDEDKAVAYWIKYF